MHLGGEPLSPIARCTGAENSNGWVFSCARWRSLYVYVRLSRWVPSRFWTGFPNFSQIFPTQNFQTQCVSRLWTLDFNLYWVQGCTKSNMKVNNRFKGLLVLLQKAVCGVSKRVRSGFKSQSSAPKVRHFCEASFAQDPLLLRTVVWELGSEAAQQNESNCYIVLYESATCSRNPCNAITQSLCFRSARETAVTSWNL